VRQWPEEAAGGGREIASPLGPIAPASNWAGLFVRFPSLLLLGFAFDAAERVKPLLEDRAWLHGSQRWPARADGGAV
jgi:hypothetical protein